ncbi:phage terminase large subunit family protein [Sinirhodobacter huangdaonensis]|uniref:Phage terminase large subunit family protein n=1 Tax=Paenirhodobacter huangdaonensis TaxID=2501515 RepID=A0A3S3PCT4_9RHOB|nr:phage terminase large subunit family protein [Sinirhodobacter huangdaonensis]RWR48029.1 phage terminase large subunit family protein [Sinirhodobacter huangdaonensis]
MPTIDELCATALASLTPPPRLRLSDWIEREVRLPEGVSSQPGPVRLWPFQREIADAIGDPLIERVTLVKPVRVGFTTLLSSAVASFVANDPASILCLLPAESDCRDYVVSDIEPIFAASPAVASALGTEQDEAGRNTLLSRRFPGGSLKVVAAKAPRNLRRHNVRFLLMDEVDGMAPTPEGSPLLLAERRTLSFPDRKIILGSTPVHEETSHVLRAYAQSDQRVFEVPCPHCGTFTEIAWAQISWPEGRPEAAFWCCPHCAAEVSERHKPAMIEAGRWRITRPEVEGHAGFRMNALISLHANAAWGKLAVEFIASKDDPTLLQTFVNTILGQGWRSEGDELDEDSMAARAEPFGLAQIPAEVLALTLGCDVQHDRLELTYVGWTESGAMLVLGHRVIWGPFDAEETWAELDALLRERFPHALGGKMAIDATAIDAGDGTSMNMVTGFCRPRTARKVFAIKGASGNRPVIERAGSKTKTGARLWIVGVDTVKTQLFARLPRPGQVRFSQDLPAVWYEQVASERAVVRYSRGQPLRNFERIPGRRAEALDCAVYAFAARQMVNINPEVRREELARAEATPAARKGPVLQSDWMRRR